MRDSTRWRAFVAAVNAAGYSMLPVRLQAEMNGDPIAAEARRAREIANDIIKPETPHARACRIRTNAARWARLETVERASNILGEQLLQKVTANTISPVDAVYFYNTEGQRLLALL
jgi:hypothetical protein